MPASLSRLVTKLEQAPDTRFLRFVNVVDFLAALEIGNVSKAKSDEVKFSCPFSGHSRGDEAPSAYMNTGEKKPHKATRWFCHSCKKKGNAITFLAEHQGISYQRAARWIKDHWAPGYTKPIDGIDAEWEQRREQFEEERNAVVTDLPTLDWAMYHDTFGVDWAEFGYNPAYENEPDVGYMLDRGFTPAELEEWGIGYDSISGRLTIPVCDADGNLVGIKGRAWEEGRKPKYMILGDTDKVIARHGHAVYGFEPYEKSLMVFGIDKWGPQQTYVMVEGEIDVMSLWKMNIPALSVSGSYVSAEQARMIRDYANEVVMFLDTDSAGSIGVWGDPSTDDEDAYPGAVALLEKFVRVKIVPKHWFDCNSLIRTGRRERVLQLLRDARPSFAVRPHVRQGRNRATIMLSADHRQREHSRAARATRAIRR